MYTIYLKDDNSLVVSDKTKRIMQRSSLVDSMHFLVPQYYNGLDMREFSCMMEYILPCSKTYTVEYLEQSAELYEEKYIEYLIPMDTKLTSEAGDIQVQLTFCKTEFDNYGAETGKQYIRKTGKSKIIITPIAKWSDIIPNEPVDVLDKKLLEINEAIQRKDDSEDAPIAMSGNNYVKIII